MKALLSLISFFCLVLSGCLFYLQSESSFSDPLYAAVADTAAVSGSCSDPAAAAFVPNMSYTINFPMPSTFQSISGCGATTALSSDVVNGDTAPTVGCSLSDVSGGFLVLSNRTPTVKYGGLQCQTQNQSLLEVHGDGSDNTNFDIAISSVSSTAWNASNKVDDALSGAKDMLFGTSGQCGGSAIVDGSDNDAATNGEVAFGGTGSGEGGSKVYIKIDYTNYDIQAATDVETLTFTFTPQ